VATEAGYRDLGGDLTVSLAFDASAFLTPDGAPRDGAPLGALLSAQARLHPDRPAVTHGSETLTFAQLDAGANRRARRLVALGVKPDDTVMIALPNGRRLLRDGVRHLEGRGVSGPRVPPADGR
jgi:non-ribosomal peptide synthetase component F